MNRTLADPTKFRPRTPAVAALALDKGVPLGHLDVDEDERAVAVLLSKKFSADGLAPIRQQAMAHLASKVRWAKATDAALTRLSGRVAYARDGAEEVLSEAELQLRLDVLDAVQRARAPITDFPAIGPKGFVGRPRKIDPWVPADWPWALTLRWFFEYAVRKYAVRPREDDLHARSDLILDAPLVDDDGNQGSRLETLDNVVPAGAWYRQLGSNGTRRHRPWEEPSSLSSDRALEKREVRVYGKRPKFRMVKDGVAQMLDSNGRLPERVQREIRADLDEMFYGVPWAYVEPMPNDDAEEAKEVQQQMLEEIKTAVAEEGEKTRHEIITALSALRDGETPVEAAERLLAADAAGLLPEDDE
jgi:hypothetical protein